MSRKSGQKKGQISACPKMPKTVQGDYRTLRNLAGLISRISNNPSWIANSFIRLTTLRLCASSSRSVAAVFSYSSKRSCKLRSFMSTVFSPVLNKFSADCKITLCANSAEILKRLLIRAKIHAQFFVWARPILVPFAIRSCSILKSLGKTKGTIPVPIRGNDKSRLLTLKHPRFHCTK